MPVWITDPGAVNAALIALVASIVGWLLRDLSRKLDALPGHVVDALRGFATAERSVAMADVNRRFDELDVRIERLTRGQELAARVELLRLLSAPEVAAQVKRQAETLLRDMTDGGG